MLCLVAQLYSTLCNPMECSPPGSSVHGILQARILEWVAVPSSTDLPNPRIEPRSPTLQADSLLSEPLRKPKNSGVGSLSLLQGIFLTQESNLAFLHCRWILHHMSCQGSPLSTVLQSNSVLDYTVHGILQARVLEWVAVPFSRGSSQPRN